MALPEPPLPNLNVAVLSTLKEMLVVLRRIDERLPPAPPASPQTDNAGTTSHPDSTLSCDVGATIRNAGTRGADTVGAEWASPAETGLTAASNEGGLQGDISSDSPSLSEPVNTAASDSRQPSTPKIYNLLESILGVLRRFDEVAIGEVDPAPGAGNNPKKSFKPKWFGLNKQQPNPALVNMDHRLKYPNDKPGHELDENARVWLAYNDEANAYDTDWIGALADSLDILLVFAGLFSAVLTTFVAQTSQLLSVQSPSGNDLWVNGLWFTSLTISLCVALFAVLSKQWLRQYLSIVTRSARDQALIRQFRFEGLKTWRVQEIVGVLPIPLHLSLILFLVGLVVFLHPLSIVLAWVSGVITLTTIALYAGANFLPLLFIDCPYRTTFTDILHVPFAYLRSGYSRLHCNVVPKVPYQNLKTIEREAACAKRTPDDQTKDVQCLHWFAASTSSASAKDLIFWSLGALMPSSHAYIQTLDIDHAFYSALWPYSSQGRSYPPWREAVEPYLDAHGGDPQVSGRMCRSLLPHGLLLPPQQYFFKDRMLVDGLQLALTAMGGGFARHVQFQYAGHRIKLEAYAWVNCLSFSLDFDKIITEFHHMQLPRAVWRRLLNQNTVALSLLPSPLVVELSSTRNPRFHAIPAASDPVVLRDAFLKDEAVKLLCGSSVTSDDLDNELRHRWSVAVAEGLLSSSDLPAYLLLMPGRYEEALANMRRVKPAERENLPVHVTYVRRGDRIFRSGWECHVTAHGITYVDHDGEQPRSLDAIPDFVKAPISSEVAQIPRILPSGWERRVAPDGKLYYRDYNTHNTSWNPPPIHAEEGNLRQDPVERHTEKNEDSTGGENLPTADGDGRSNSDSGKGKEKEGVEDGEKGIGEKEV